MNERSLLYVPGHKPQMFAKAAAAGADGIILDLEDAVPPSAKDAARQSVCAWLNARPSTPPVVWVRVNGGELLIEDARAVAGAPVDGIYVPKATVESLERMDAILDARDVPLTALVESAAGVLEARDIAAHPRVARLAIGEADLCGELGIVSGDDAREMIPMRMQVVLASAAAGLEPPVGPVSTDFRDLDALRASTESIRRMGFGGRAAIHPAQVAPINDAFTPSEEEVAAARRLLERFEAAGGGVTTGEDGRMIDEAFVRAARRTLARV
ncbi:MAG: HpcH/HpaI aldolase/citrate lyase family protein, partial [Actinomycetota bacterium]